jgi:hypothetical protein
MSDLLELLGFAALAAAGYEWSGRALCLLVIAIALFTLGLSMDGVKPIRALKIVVLRRWQAYRANRATRKAQLT